MAIIAAQITSGRAAESGHWYDREGNPVYEIRSAKGDMRPVTLRDARKFGWVPGFSSIAAMEYKPMLERWKIDQALLAALTLPRLPDESDDAFIQRAREDSGEQARKAANRGTSIHAAIQSCFENAPAPLETLPFVLPSRKWVYDRFGIEGWSAEASFAHALGYGGKSDLINRSVQVVIDFKCKDFDETKEVKDLAFPEHCMQLSAYAEGFRMSQPNCVNIFVSTRVPGLIRVREWDNSEIATAWEAFQCLLKLWQIRRNYASGFHRAVAA